MTSRGVKCSVIVKVVSGESPSRHMECEFSAVVKVVTG